MSTSNNDIDFDKLQAELDDIFNASTKANNETAKDLDDLFDTSTPIASITTTNDGASKEPDTTTDIDDFDESFYVDEPFIADASNSEQLPENSLLQNLLKSTSNTKQRKQSQHVKRTNRTRSKRSTQSQTSTTSKKSSKTSARQTVPMTFTASKKPPRDPNTIILKDMLDYMLGVHKKSTKINEINEDDFTTADNEILKEFNNRVRDGNLYILDAYGIVVRKNDYGTTKSPFAWSRDANNNIVNMFVPPECPDPDKHSEAIIRISSKFTSRWNDPKNVLHKVYLKLGDIKETAL